MCREMTVNKNGLQSTLTQITVTGQDQSFKIRIPKDEMFRVKEIFTDQCYSIPKYRSRSGRPTVLDVGANIGLFSIYMKMVDPQSRIFCYEPVTSTFSLLEENTKSLDSIQCFHCGLFNQETIAKINVHSKNAGLNSIKLKDPDHLGIEDIELKDAGREFDRLGIESLDIVKIDTEGCEIEILESLGERLSATDYVLLEYHSERDRRRVDALLGGFSLFSARSNLVGFGTLKYINNQLLLRVPLSS